MTKCLSVGGGWFAVTLIACASYASTLARAAEGDWAQWRGPNRDGICAEKGLLQQWPGEGPPLVWKANGLGEGFSTVAVVGDRIFTTGDKGGDSFMVVLNRGKGQAIWSSKLGKAGAPGWGGFAGPRSTPATDGQIVIAVGQWGEVACFDASSGKEIWRKDMERDFGGSRPEWGFAESPLLDGDKVVVTPGGLKGAVVALNKGSGQVIWQSKDFKDPAHYSSLVGAEIGGVNQYIQLTEQSVAGVAATDGKLLWRATRRGATAVIPTPIVQDNLVYVSSGYGIGCNLFRINASGGQFSAEQVYANKIMENHHGGVIRVGNFVYGHSDSKGWTCQDLKTGRDIWQEKQKLGKGSIAYADGRLYLREENGKGTVALIEASPQGYREHGRFNPPNRSDKNSWAHPVIAGGKLYLRDQDVLLCYDVKAR